MCDYNVGFDPRKEEENPEIEVEVRVCLSLSKTFKIKVSDYKKYIEEDELCKSETIDFNDCNLIKEVEDQVILPHKMGKYIDTYFSDIHSRYYIKNLPLGIKGAIKDNSGWEVDDFEVIPE